VAKKSLLAKSLSFPLYVAALAAGLKAFTLVEAEEMRSLAPNLDKILAGVLTFLLVIIVIRVAGLFYFDVYLHSTRGVRLPPLLPKVALAAAYLVTLIVVLKAVFPAFPMSSLVATSAVTSLVLGLALQPILGNFFAGLVISLERPFRINDWVRVNGTDGRVVEITWRTTHLRTRDNDDLVIPNAQIADQELLNYFYPHPLHMERIYIGAHYKTPPYRVKQAALDAVAEVPSVLEKPSPSVYLHSFDDSAITYEVRIWIEDIAHMPRIVNEVRSGLWEKFRRRGITIPFPIRTLEIEPSASRLELVRGQSKESSALSETAFAARLFVAQGPDQGKAFELDGSTVKLGRSQECQLSLTEPRVSSEHLQIEWRPKQGFFLIDLESTNGTLINERQADEQLLHHLDRIRIGDTVMTFEIHGN
jgi:small-conductance mechanosensitive channel